MRAKSITPRAGMLWITGVVVLVILIAIQARVSWLWRHFALVYRGRTACKMGLDLGERGSSEYVFGPSVTRPFKLHFCLRVFPPEDSGGYEGGLEYWYAGGIEDALKEEGFEISWRLRSQGRDVADGVITEGDLNRRIHGFGVSYIFGEQKIPLTAARKYRLVAKVERPSKTLNQFAPSLIIGTEAWRKGFPLLSWTGRKTVLVLLVGLGLIAAGFAKHCYERRRCRASTDAE